MNILIFGATGMVGQGVLRESLLAVDVANVKTVGRAATGQKHPKLTELVMRDLFDTLSVERELMDYDACFFCLGVSSAGMKEEDYSRLTHDLTVAIAATLSRLNPLMTFVYVSGASTDSTEQGSSMWARVKGRTENALLRLAFKAVYLFRPGLIQPKHGARSKTTAYRVAYTLMAPVIPLLRTLMPSSVATTETIGQAMLTVARRGWQTAVLEAEDIEKAARSGSR